MFWIVLAILASLNAEAQDAHSRFSADTYAKKPLMTRSFWMVT